MTCQLTADCLSEIFEYLEEDKFTLYSCLLVNRLWCTISVRVLWRNIWNFKSPCRKRSLKVASSIISTLIACLPNESKDLLYDNNIFILPPTSKSPLFNYAAFCKAISTHKINEMIFSILSEKTNFYYSFSAEISGLVTTEIIKLLTSQIYSLKKLDCYRFDCDYINFSFNNCPGAKNLLELGCLSTLPSNFFYQLSKVCHNLQSMAIIISNNNVSNGLKELISLQNNLKNIALSTFDNNWADIIPTLTKHSSSITKLRLYSDEDNLPLSFIGLFSNLQEIILSFPNVLELFESFESEDFAGEFVDFKNLQNVNFPKLQTLKIPFHCPKVEYVIKFLENNGKNLKKLYLTRSDRALSLSIAKFCPNIKSIYVIFKNGELDILKTIFIKCQYLESIKILCGVKHLDTKKVLETVAKYSPNNFRELKIYSSSYSYVSSKELKSFFISWKNRTPKILLKLIMITGDYFSRLNLENMKIVKKYENLGIIKFETKSYYEEEEEEELHY